MMCLFKPRITRVRVGGKEGVRGTELSRLSFPSLDGWRSLLPSFVRLALPPSVEMTAQFSSRLETHSASLGLSLFPSLPVLSYSGTFAPIRCPLSLFHSLPRRRRRTASPRPFILHSSRPFSQSLVYGLDVMTLPSGDLVPWTPKLAHGM